MNFAMTGADDSRELDGAIPDSAEERWPSSIPTSTTQIRG